MNMNLVTYIMAVEEMKREIVSIRDMTVLSVALVDRNSSEWDLD